MIDAAFDRAEDPMTQPFRIETDNLEGLEVGIKHRPLIDGSLELISQAGLGHTNCANAAKLLSVRARLQGAALGALVGFVLGRFSASSAGDRKD